VELYFETGGADLTGTAPSRPPPEQPAPRQTPPRETINLDDIPDDIGPTQSAALNVNDDEALARRLMQEDIDSQPDAVRSPIAARNDILVHPDEDYDVPYGYSARRGISPA
jgi:hypothetical protein